MSHPPPPDQPRQGNQRPMPAPEHPRAMTALVLGILSLALCQLLGPFAWRIGGQTMREIDAARGRMGGRGLAQAGYILGIVATVLLLVAVAFVAIVIVVAVIGATMAL